MKNALFLLFLMLLSFGFYGCDFSRYKQIEKLEKQTWQQDNLISFDYKFEGENPQKHDLYLHLRHDFDYPYRNIWVKIFKENPDGSLEEKEAQFKLATKEGYWLGKVLSNIVDHRFWVFEDLLLEDNGTYTFKISHHMRTEQLDGVHAVGLEIIPKQE